MMRLLNLGKVYGLFLFALFFSFSTLAATTKQATVYTQFSDQDIVNILKTQYDNVKIAEKGIILITADEIKCLINNLGEYGFQFKVLFSDATKFSLSDLNKWNREKRFMRAYFDENNALALQADLDIGGGITRESVLKSVRTFMFSVWMFQQQ